MKTFIPGEKDINCKWYIVDASGATLGRLASRIAQRLRGKHKPIYTPSLDTGDFIVVINAEKITVTGKKLTDKMYYSHSGYPGGLKAKPLGKLLKADPTKVIETAVEGMLPDGRLGKKMLKKLKVYAGGNHPHAAQNPEQFSI